ncbi:MAG: type III PLP-dependent enzyme [Planctomycetes bacterium]|nr:type III PLP-dependent enzyme [Planctomycetota bacterium]
MLHYLPETIFEFINAELDAGTETPFIIIDLNEVKHNYEQFFENFERITPHFAVKSNPHPEIVRTLADIGANFDIASVNELQLVLDSGATPSRVIFANPVKKYDEIVDAIALGADFFTLDSVEELMKIEKAAAAVNKQVELLVRIWVPNYGSIVDLSSKFGADSETIEAIIKRSLETEFTSIIGFAFHVGSQCLNPANFKKAFKIAHAEIEKAQKLGIETAILDIGGGMPVNYMLDTSYEEDIVSEILKLIETIPDEIKLIAEPGRNFVATAATLVTKIIGKTMKLGKTWYYVDESIYQTFSGKIFDFTDYKIFPLLRNAIPASEVVIAGNTCDGHDIISRSTLLTPDLEVDDILYVPNVGAYTTASASNFNGFNSTKIIIYK